jgi:hypothetical protein
MPVLHIQPEHPLLGLSQERYLEYYREHGPVETDALVSRLNAAIVAEREDPFTAAYRPDHWRAADARLAEDTLVCIFGGNRSGKSTYAAYTAAHVLVDGPSWLPEGRRMAKPPVVACFHSSERSSILQQQALIYQQLPRAWRDIKRLGAKAKVSYTVATGFSDSILVLPNGGTCVFFNYKQDVSVLEGYEFDFAWLDELFPAVWLETIEYRLATRRGRLLATFTPVRGYTSSVASIVAGGEVVETAALDERVFADGPELGRGVLVPGCPAGHVPVRLKCRRPRASALWFLSQWNVYSPFEEIVERVTGQPDAVRLIRCAGWAARTEGGVFARYSPAAHVVPLERFARLAGEAGAVRYCVTDPGGRKNWFIKWYLITAGGHIILYREWPDWEGHGEWAVPATSDSVRPGALAFRAGPAQMSGAGKGIADYKRLILELEGWVWDGAAGTWDGGKAEKIALRLIDPRFGGMAVPGGEHETSIISLMEEEQKDGRGRVVGPAMVWDSAPAAAAKDGMTPVGIGIQLLNDAMSWDESQPLSPLNCPRWYHTPNCQQSALAYREYTGAGGERDPLKDIIDPDRYLLNYDPRPLAPGEGVATGGGACH